MIDKELFEVRRALLIAFCRKHGYDGLLLTRPDNFAMATGGKRNYINTYSDKGANSLFITKEGDPYFVGNAIEAPRQMAEELGPLGCGERTFPWFEGSAAAIVSNEFGDNIASDDGALGPNVHGALSPLRALLTPAELDKYRELGQRAADAMTATLETIEKGALETDIAATLAAEAMRRRLQTPVVLVAADERIARFRHPLPTQAGLRGDGLTEAAVKRYVMVVGTFLKEGLFISITRFKAVDELPNGIEDAYKRICAVDAAFQQATQPGRTLGDVFDDGAAAYSTFGFAGDEWHNHHQGGPTGYAGRTAKGAPGVQTPVLDTEWPARAKEIMDQEIPFGAAFAWNPSAPGVKSEDTFIVAPDGTQTIVTATAALPAIDMSDILDSSAQILKSGISY